MRSDDINITKVHD